MKATGSCFLRGLWLAQECAKKGKQALEDEFHAKYRQMYPQLGLVLQQKERIKLASDVYDCRTTQQTSVRDTYKQALLERNSTSQPAVSWVEACRCSLEPALGPVVGPHSGIPVNSSPRNGLGAAIAALSLNRDVLQAHEAIHGLQASETAMRENRVMFSIVMFKKVLNLVQQARLAATSFPLLPCVKTVSPEQT